MSKIRDQSVYILTNLDGEVRYVGRTNDPVRRGIEHKNDPLHPWRKDYTLTVVATGLTVDEARFVEQAFMLRSPNCPFVLFVGTKKLVKRKEFEHFISQQLII